MPLNHNFHTDHAFEFGTNAIKLARLDGALSPLKLCVKYKCAILVRCGKSCRILNHDRVFDLQIIELWLERTKVLVIDDDNK